jgi:hypothetical protein
MTVSQLTPALLTAVLRLSTRLDSTNSGSIPLHRLNSTPLVKRYSPGADPTENIVRLLMWVAWYRMFHCSGTLRLVLDHTAALLPAVLLLLRYVTADITCSSVACAVIVMLISCLQCHNPVIALYVLRQVHGTEWVYVAVTVPRVLVWISTRKPVIMIEYFMVLPSSSN